MINKLSTAKLFCLFMALAPMIGFSKATQLPVLSVVGKTCEVNERVSINVKVESSKYSPEYCFSEVDMFDRTLRYPHTFSIHNVTISDYTMAFGLDFDIQERIKDKVMGNYPQGIMFEGKKISSESYFYNCGLQIKKVTIYMQQTNLVIRDSFYDRLENTFILPQGTTQTADFSFNRAGDRVRLKVSIEKSK